MGKDATMKELRVTGRILPVSEATRRRNPQLYGNQDSSRVGGLPAQKPKQDQIPTLDQLKERALGRRTRLVLRITLVRCGSRSLDDDNLASCFKGLRDSIATTLQIDDADKRVEWRYGQVEGVRGHYGTIVRFDLL